jgi:hypothetical protein
MDHGDAEEAGGAASAEHDASHSYRRLQQAHNKAAHAENGHAEADDHSSPSVLSLESLQKLRTPAMGGAPSCLALDHHSLLIDRLELCPEKLVGGCSTKRESHQRHESRAQSTLHLFRPSS